MTIRRAVLPALLALPVALAACGGSSDEDKIRAIVKDGSDDPSTICDNASKAVLQALGGADKCKEASKTADTDGKSTVESVKVAGEKATARVKDDSGTQSVQFVKEGGDWKVAG